MERMKRVEKSWGHEIWIVNNDLYCGKELFIKRGKTSSKGWFHYHKIKDETFYILEGKLILDYYEDYVNAKTVILKPNMAIWIKPLMRHRFSASWFSFGCRFIEFSTHHEDSDSYYDSG